MPEWNLSATHSDLNEQFIQTKVMLDTYEVFLSDLVAEYQTKASARKVEAVERARRIFSVCGNRRLLHAEI